MKNKPDKFDNFVNEFINSDEFDEMTENFKNTDLTIRQSEYNELEDFINSELGELEEFMDDGLDELIHSEIASYIPLKTRLKNAGLTFAQAEEKTETFIRQFTQSCSKYNLPFDHKLNFCQALFSLIKTKAFDNIDEEMLELYSTALHNQRLLFYNEQKFPDRQKVEDYLIITERIANTVSYLKTTACYQEKFEQLLAVIKNQKFSAPKTSPNQDDQYFLFQKFIEHLDVPDSAECEKILLDNIALLCNMLANSKELTQIAPLFIYLVMTMHTNRLTSSKDFNFRIDKLFEKFDYQIEKDNGKNFKSYLTYLELFQYLDNYFSKNPAVDAELARRAFANITNLCQWYYQFCEYDEKLNFPMPIESFIKNYLDVTIDANYQFNSNCSQKEISDFFNYKKSYYRQVEEQVSKYIQDNPHILRDFIALKNPDHTALMAIINEILSNAGLPMKYIVSDELRIIQVAIYQILGGEVDKRLEVEFIKTGKKLIGQLSVSFYIAIL